MFSLREVNMNIVEFLSDLVKNMNNVISVWKVN